MPALNAQQKAVLTIIRDKAKAKLVDIDKRILAEAVFAAENDLKAATIEPLQAVQADLVVAAIEAISSVPKDLEEVVKVQRKSCGALKGAEVALRADQLAAILDCALGVAHAPVQG